MRPDQYRVAIPSYRRAETCRDKTIALLLARGITPDRITVWVADRPEQIIYQAALSHTGVNVEISAPTLHGSRNALWRAYEPGTWLLNADDDLTDIYRPKGKQDREPIQDLHTEFTDMFTNLGLSGLSIVGVYPADNPYFMRGGYSTNLRYIVGALYGIRIEPGPHMDVTLEDKEDYERTILHYLYAGGVLRNNGIGIRTRYYTEPGGMQETRTPQRITESAYILHQRFPTLTRLHQSKGRGTTEIALIPKPSRH
jgi:hypothetical protein